MSKRAAFITAGVSLAVIALAALAFFFSRQRPLRRRPFPRRPEAATKAPVTVPPVNGWTAAFESLPPAQLDRLLDRIESEHADLYAKFSLGYLHARARLENGDPRGAERRLAPYLAPASPLADLALYHRAEIEVEAGNHAAASRDRQALIFGGKDAVHRDEAIEDESEYLSSQKSAATLIAFAARLDGMASPKLRRELQARVAEVLVRGGDVGGAMARALPILAGGTMDDAAERAGRVLDRPAITSRLSPAQLILVGTTMQNHRHFDRAVTLLSAALGRTPAAPVQAAVVHAPIRHPKKVAKVPARRAKKTAAPAAPAAAAQPNRDDVVFAIGRSYFGAENYAAARQTYLGGANGTRDPRRKAEFFLHASRAAQLLGDDKGAEQLMTAAIAVPGKYAATTAALTQRLRTRLKQRRMSEAAADFVAIRKIAPNEHAVADGALAYAIAMVAYGNPTAALGALNSVPPQLLDKNDQPEFAYWRARALESRDPHAAFESYLTVLRAPVPTHFAYFARDRLDASTMAPKLAQELAARDAQLERETAAKDWMNAKRTATDRILLSGRGRAATLRRLTAVYEQLPPYRTIAELKPDAFPALPDAAADRTSLLLSLGLFDEAVDEIPKRWPLRPLSSALTQSLALNRGSASKPSIYAIEVLMKSVPDDYVPDLLPMTVRQLLYPRYYFDAIADDSKRFDADPTLVLSIMREESRFDPRAKSEAAARGLLQFIITTARDIGREIGLVDVSEEDLYDPRVIIRLGAKYVGSLMKQFGGNRYMTAAAYNAGPKQVALWSRLAPGAGDDYFLSSINFEETKDYVRKVMNSYKRYGEIYGNAGPQGGLRAEP